MDDLINLPHMEIERFWLPNKKNMKKTMYQKRRRRRPDNTNKKWATRLKMMMVVVGLVIACGWLGS